MCSLATLMIMCTFVKWDKCGFYCWYYFIPANFIPQTHRNVIVGWSCHLETYGSSLRNANKSEYCLNCISTAPATYYENVINICCKLLTPLWILVCAYRFITTNSCSRLASFITWSHNWQNKTVSLMVRTYNIKNSIKKLLKRRQALIGFIWWWLHQSLMT